MTESVLTQSHERRESEEHDEQRHRLADELARQTAPPPRENAPRGDVVPRALDLETLGESAPTAPPVDQQPVAQFANKEEARDALERLRMTYIAGDLTREDYHNAKASIERALSTLPENEGPPRTLSLSSE